MYNGTHPVFVWHVKEIEAVQLFLTRLDYRLKIRGKDRGERYRCLLRVNRKCADLLLKMYAEESDIILLDDLDARWTRLVVRFARDHQLTGLQKAG